MLSTQVVHASQSLVLFMKLKPVTANFFLNSCLYNKSEDPGSPEHSHAHSVKVSLYRDRRLLQVTLKIDMKSVALVFA